MDARVVERAVAAAVAVASEQGLRVTDAVPVGTGSNVIVHLRPSPVVARVMVGTVVLHPDPRAWLTRELDVGASLRALHDALAEYRGPLPPRSAVLGEIDWLLHALSGADGVSELAAERDRLAGAILEDSTDQQPIHGDASFSNLLATGSGPRWNDFEDVCVGGIEWDLAGVLADARAARGDAFSAEVLAAYGGACDPAALERVDQVHALYGALWRRYLRRGR